MLGLRTATGDAAWGRCTGMEGGAVIDDRHPVTDAEHMTHTHELLTHAARRAQDRPAYVAWALARVQARAGFSDEALAARLGLATRFGLTPEPLATLLRAAGVLTPRRHDPTA